MNTKRFCAKSLCRSIIIIKVFIHFTGTAAQQLPAVENYASDNGNPEELQIRKEIEGSIAVLVNRDGVLPLGELERGRFAVIIIGDAEVFADRVTDYLEMPVIRIDLLSGLSVAKGLKRLEEYDRVIAGIAARAVPANGEPLNHTLDLIRKLEEKSSVAVVFGSPAPSDWKGLERLDGLVAALDESSLAQDLSAQLVFGATGTSATLPEAAGDHFPAGWGMETSGGLRLKYTIPEEAGLDSRVLYRRIDSIVNTGLDAEAFPGCRVLVALGGKVILDNAYGYHTYHRRVKVEKGDIYDLASVTKITGPLPIYMKLVDENAIDLGMPLSHYWDDWQNRLFRRSNKEDLTLIDLLTHQSGITPYINYWERTVRRGKYIRRWYRHEELDGYSYQIGSHLYLRDNFNQRVYRDIRRSDLSPHGEYRYSCLPFIVSPRVIESVEGDDYTEVLYADFFKPLGASTLRYNPRSHFKHHRIVPTEVDNNFRRTLVRGFVHDEAAAVLGGVSGNAGLFTTAGDLAKLLQMYLNGGEYGGRRYLSEEVITEFARVQFPENDNRRGIGFDKPLIDNHERSDERAYPCKDASPDSFGHSGFTGTFVWMDPDYDLLYIFLSNRVHPTRDNNMISTLNIRTEILQAVYDTIGIHR